MFQEQFAQHLQLRGESPLAQDASVNFNVHGLDAAMVGALKRADWNDAKLNLDPLSIKSKLGIYNFAPHSLDSKKWLQQVEDGRLIFRQENVGEDKTKVAAKSHELDCSGRMTSASDLHMTISNLWAMSSFITEEAGQSEPWKSMTRLQGLWHSSDGKNWLDANRATRHLVYSLMLECQSILGACVTISNSLPYRQAAAAKLTISPRAHINANTHARDVMRTNVRMVDRLNLGHLIMQPAISRHFQIYDERGEQLQVNPGPNRERNRQRGGADAPPRFPPVGNHPDQNRDRHNRNGPPGPPATRTGPPLGNLPQDQINAQKLIGLVRFNGAGFRVPVPVDVFELNGTTEGLAKPCMNHLCRDRFCRHGNECNMKHINSSRGFTPENKTKFQNFVRDHMNFQMVNNGTP
jgi:hypothetical protein